MERLRQLPGALDTVERDRRLWLGLGRWLAAAAGWAGLCIVLVMIDAWLGLASGGLWLILIMLIAAAVTGLGYGIVAMLRGWNPMRTARAVEEAMGLKQDELSTAISLSQGVGAGMEATSQSLRDEAIRRGDALAGKVGALSLSQNGRVKSALWWLLAIVGLLVLSLVMWPGVWNAVVPRVLMPWADLPPYTSLDFQVTSNPDPLYVGKALTIEAVIGQGDDDSAGEAWVVFKRTDGTREKVNMFRRVSGETDDVYRHFMSLSGIAEPGVHDYYIETPGGRSGWHRLDVLPTPLFEKVTATLTYPAYTSWSPSVVQLSGRQQPTIKALVATTVLIQATSNVQLRGGEVTIYDAAGQVRQTVSMSPGGQADAITAEGSFVIESDGRFEMVLIGMDGSRSDQPFAGELEAVADREPLVEIVEPEPILLAVEGWDVDVLARARDDVGIDTMSLHYSINDAWASPVAMEQEIQKNGMNGKTTLSLKDLGAKPGDTVRYYVSATDKVNTQRSDPGRVGESSMHVIRIISREEYDDMARSQYRADDLAQEWAAFEAALDMLEKQREQLLKQMQELQEQIETQGGEPTTEQRESMQQLSEQFESYRRDALELAEQMRERSEQNQLYEFEKQYKDMLRRTGMEMQAQASAAQAMKRALAGGDPKQTDQAMKQFQQQNRPFDESMQQERQQMRHDAQKLAQAGQMMESANRLSNIIQEQREIADRLGEFENKQTLAPQDELQLQRLSERQQDLKKQLQQTQQQLRQQCEAASTSLPNMSASAARMADAIDGMEIAADQAAAGEAAGQGDPAQAAARARQAAEKLESLMSDCQSQGSSNAEADLDQALSLSGQSLQQAIQQMQQSAQGTPGMPNQGQTGQTGQGASGMSGGSMNLPIAGPRRPGEPSDSDRGGSDRREQVTSRGSARGDFENMDDAAGVLDPGRVTQRQGMALDATVSPPVYEQATRDYFERLVEDEASGTAP